ncbi:MAG: type IV secretion system DNA-binding domain-containing protein [Armatimonadetes bacterium]|nr:type IV secretion system DNA-binding domain-containing protein [Armatimonadota bacterium]
MSISVRVSSEGGKQPERRSTQRERRSGSALDVYDADLPGTLSLGVSYSEKMGRYEVAKIADRDRETHLYVVGATGTGKTKFLECLIRQDIDRGNGFCVIDPHGDLVEDIKGFLACRYAESQDPREVSERTVLIDPTDAESTVTFNPLEMIPAVSAAEQAAQLISSFRKIWSDSWGVRMEDLLRNTLIALSEAGMTLAEVPTFLTRRTVREVVLEKNTNPAVREYFYRFESLTDRSQLTWIEPVMNKLGALLADSRMHQMFFSSQSSFDLREVMDNRRFLLVKLDKGKLNDSADLLGSLLMAKIQTAAFSRSDTPEGQRVPFHLYIDEFQNFASESFKVALSEARKYRLSLVMAHQSLAQIPDDLRSLILGNTGLQVYFRVNRQDAQLLAKEAFEYSGYEVKSVRSMSPTFWSLGEEWERRTASLQKLPPRSCYVKHKLKGGVLPIRTMEITPAAKALGMSQTQYAGFLKTVPFGSKYLLRREEIAAQASARFAPVEEEARSRQARRREQAVAAEPPPRSAKKEEPRSEPQPFIHAGGPMDGVLAPPGKESQREHKRLQNLIKLEAEKAGYRATIEHPTPDGQGRIDVALERDGTRVACEVSVTTTPEHELGNIQKCLAAGCDRVILCSPEMKTLTKVQALVRDTLAETHQASLLFLTPEDLVVLLEQEAADQAGREERIKGYKVKVRYQPVPEKEKERRRGAITDAVLRSLRSQ